MSLGACFEGEVVADTAFFGDDDDDDDDVTVPAFEDDDEVDDVEDDATTGDDAEVTATEEGFLAAVIALGAPDVEDDGGGAVGFVAVVDFVDAAMVVLPVVAFAGLCQDQ